MKDTLKIAGCVLGFFSGMFLTMFVITYPAVKRERETNNQFKELLRSGYCHVNSYTTGGRNGDVPVTILKCKNGKVYFREYFEEE